MSQPSLFICAFESSNNSFFRVKCRNFVFFPSRLHRPFTIKIHQPCCEAFKTRLRLISSKTGSYPARTIPYQAVHNKHKVSPTPPILGIANTKHLGLLRTQSLLILFSRRKVHRSKDKMSPVPRLISCMRSQCRWGYSLWRRYPGCPGRLVEGPKTLGTAGCQGLGSHSSTPGKCRDM